MTSPLRLGLVLLSLTTTALAEPRPPGLTLNSGSVNGTVVYEQDASAGAFMDTTSIAPDLAVGVTDDLTLSLVHSTFGRTGFRGTAGSGLCATDACTRTYDNAGVEALYSLRRGPLSIAANAGVHALSFERDSYVVKLGGKLRYRAGTVVLASLPSVFVAVSNREAMKPNRDRLWVPVTAMAPVAGGLSLGLATGVKLAFAEVARSYEIAAGALAQYAYSKELQFGASWIHGKALGGEGTLPMDNGFDYRAINVWVSATH